MRQGNRILLINGRTQLCFVTRGLRIAFSWLVISASGLIRRQFYASAAIPGDYSDRSGDIQYVTSAQVRELDAALTGADYELIPACVCACEVPITRPPTSSHIFILHVRQPAPEMSTQCCRPSASVRLSRNIRPVLEIEVIGRWQNIYCILLMAFLYRLSSADCTVTSPSRKYSN